MKRVLLLLFTITILIGICTCPAYGNSNTITVYVSPNGNDSNDGSLGHPLKTLVGSKNKVQQLKTTNSGSAFEVVFKEGTYFFSNTVEFNAVDSGTDASPITYKAADGENVYFKGSMKLNALDSVPVTDTTILNKLYPKVRDKIIQINLKQQGYPYDIVPRTGIRGPEGMAGGEYAALYLNGKEQMLAQWPNGDDAYAFWNESLDSRLTIRYSENNPARWTNAKNWWVGGYPGYDYRYERNSVASMNSVDKTVTFKAAPDFGIVSKESKAWKAFNLLEEIDVPGEWYVDTDTMMLYYYPPYALNDTDFEISLLNSSMIKLNSATNIWFSGIEFSQTQSGIFYMNEVKGIKVDNCSFKNISGTAILTTSNQLAQTQSYYWQRQNINGAYNCQITNNIFENIGGYSVYLNGAGNVDTLESGNNIIENNVFFRCSMNAKNYPIIRLGGCGTKVLHNNISSSPYQAIWYYGNDHEIKYNEIYNTGKFGDDQGAIYTGRNYIQRGTEIAYNYIHDVNSIENYSKNFDCALYFDDRIAGQKAHHNIIVNSSVPVYACGQDNSFTDNITVNNNLGLYFTDNYQDAAGRKDESVAAVDSILNKNLYYTKYPNIQRGLLDAYATKNAFNTVTGNLTVNAASISTGSSTSQYGTLANNISYSAFNDFVDPQNGDYRVKNGSQIKLLLLSRYIQIIVQYHRQMLNLYGKMLMELIDIDLL